MHPPLKTPSLKICLVQSELRWREPAANRSHLEELIRAAGPADLYLLPETFTTGFLGESGASDEDMQGPTLDWLRQLARETDAALSGSLVITEAGARRNRLVFVSPDGSVRHYDKRHLFSFAGENQRYVAGHERVVFEFRGWRICPQVCYDLRFPAWCRVREADYDLLLFVANWPSRRVAHWDTLLQARAIENQCFVAAVNRVGADGNGMEYPGHSAIYGPLGEVVVEPWSSEGCRGAVIDLESVRTTREKFPFAREADTFTLS